MALKMIHQEKHQQMSQLIIENPQLSVKKSIDFMKKITVVSLSYITSARQIFPSADFEIRKWEDKRIKILKGKENKTPSSKKMFDFIRNALTLVESRHLKKLFLVIQKENEKPIEVYTIHFKYNLNEIECHVENEMDVATPDNEMPVAMKEQMKQLFFCLDDYSSTLPPLPGEYEVTLRLELKDDKDLVLPKIFVNMDTLDFKFSSDIRSIKLGHADSKFTKFVLSTKRDLTYTDENEEINNKETALIQSKNALCNGSSSTANAVQITQDLNMLFDGSDDMYKTSGRTPEQFDLYGDFVNSPNNNENSETKKLSETMSSVHLQDKEVKCICELQDDLLETIECATCSTHQHKACYKLLEHEEVERHICVNCHKPDTATRTCTNPDLLNEKGKVEALYRRALSLCHGNSKVSANTFVSNLNLSRKDALKILDRLIEDGCFLPESKKRNQRTVHTEQLTENINQHFNTANLIREASLKTEEYVLQNNAKALNNKSGKRIGNVEEEINMKRLKVAS